jgi:hypothetical protein
MKVQRENRGIALYSFFNLDSIWRWVVNVTPRPLYRRGWSGTHCIGGWGGAQGRSGRGKENTDPTGTRWPDRPTRSESLYRLSYLGRPSRVMSPEYAKVQDDFSIGTFFITLFPNSNRQADVSSYTSAAIRRFGCSTSLICFMILSGETKKTFSILTINYTKTFSILPNSVPNLNLVLRHWRRQTRNPHDNILHYSTEVKENPTPSLLSIIGYTNLSRWLKQWLLSCKVSRNLLE